ncbi:MAG: hypothetical protein WCQ82_04760 [Bacteroidaceae bacterium]|nr:hypothetical protein [Bacteroidaceae bacterium]
MKSLLKNLGLIAVLIGASILIACHFTANTSNNTILGGSLALMIIGLVAHIMLNKKFTD